MPSASQPVKNMSITEKMKMIMWEQGLSLIGHTSQLITEKSLASFQFKKRLGNLAYDGTDTL